MNQLNILLLVLCSAYNSDTSSFLIYNKDHNKCVYVVSATVVQAALCDASSKAQHFQWISSSQIISLSFNLCLGSKEIKDWVKIILLPCNDLSPVQTWECKDESLFGLKGYPLHLNYGNRDEPNVMLYSGKGVWSRWLIYGTSETLCSSGYQDGYYSDVPVPSITVFRQMEDKERVIIMCSFGRKLIQSSFQLSLKSEYNYDLKNPLCFSNNVSVFDVKVSPPVSFTCVHQINSVVNRQSETYTYSLPDFAEDHHSLDNHEEGVSSFYISFLSFIAVSLFIMTAAVIVTTIKSKAKGSVNTGTDNDYIQV